MSEADVTLIHDEDVLRRMWQQTEDFSKKKEIRAHMYRLREERLRNLYSPDLTVEGKGCEFSSSQGHVKSFADQTFQSMKSKEVRDAGSPPKEFTYRGQELKDLSNAGWNVESENKVTDDGHTQIRTVNANIEGKYDVEGGHGQFAAVDKQSAATTEYKDENTSLKKNESSSNTAAHEQVVRQSEDGTQFSSTTSSSTQSSSYQQVSSTKHESVPNVKDSKSTSRNESELVEGELISRKVDYPDDDTKVVVETRKLADGTRVTSTRREYRVPAQTKSEHVSRQTKSERYATTARRDTKESISKSNQESTHNQHTHKSIVDNNKVVEDFNKTQHAEHLRSSQTSHFETHSNETKVSESVCRDTEHTIDNQAIRDVKKVNQSVKDTNIDKNIDKTTYQSVKDTNIDKNIDKTKYQSVKDTNIDKNIEKKTYNDQYETTYQSDYTQKKISTDYSPTHQAWASTLRSDTPTRTPTRASSPGSRTYMSSTSSLRSSVSPDKSYRKPSSRGASPSKFDRQSPVKSYDHYSSTQTSNSVIESKSRTTNRSGSSPSRTYSPVKKPDEDRRQNGTPKSSASPERKPTDYNRGVSPSEATRPEPSRFSQSPSRKPPTGNRASPARTFSKETSPEETFPRNKSSSPDRKPGYTKPTAASQPKTVDSPTNTPSRNHSSPERSSVKTSTVTKAEKNYKFIDEETKASTRTDRKSPKRDAHPLSPTLKDSRSPSPPKGPVTFIDEADTTTKSNVTVKDSTDIKTYKSHTRSSQERENITLSNKKVESSIRYETDKMHDKVEVTVRPTSPTKKTSRVSQSPAKEKYLQTTDFLSTERNEEINNRKNHRQLITPSSSPTRKPETTGQSSPTTSVSEIIYFSSPPLKKTTNVTSHDEQTYFSSDVTDTTTQTKRPESLNVVRSPSPTKIPCRSPSPQKGTPKDKLPRKSSLKKKPSADIVTSPNEKPPSSFIVSPTDETADFPNHHVVKKDNPEKSDEMRPKPPLERRETYEERCRKILGMMEDSDKSKETTSRDSPVRRPYSSNSTPTQSPSPQKKLYAVFDKVTDTKITDSTGLIKKEKQESVKSEFSKKTLSRESSPVKTVKKNENLDEKKTSYRSTASPTRSVSDKPKSEEPPKIVDRPKHLRSPSPAKTSSLVEKTTEFLLSEREQQILDKVQKSLRKLSPEREYRSPSREKSPYKTTTSLQDLDIKTSESTTRREKVTDEIKSTSTKKEVTDIKKEKTEKISSPHSTPAKKPAEKTPDSPTKTRTTSPKKFVPTNDKTVPQSPKTTSPKQKEPTVSGYIRKPSPSSPKTDKLFNFEDRKTTTTKQSSTKSSVATGRSTVKTSQTSFKPKVQENVQQKRDAPKDHKENDTPKKDDIKVTRTTSETSIQTKKPTPQRNRSKPEIQIHEIKTKHNLKIDQSKMPKSPFKIPQKPPTKPKSATALNVVTNEKDIIVDVEHAKSSRENSPDRICPTPVNVADDVGTPRLPDEVSEPDDEFQKRTHHIIHETESIVDDIVEISEDEELFLKANVDKVTNSDECLLSVNDKVSKFTQKIDDVKKPKESTTLFKDIERNVHSDFVSDDLKHDECLMTVQEKVTKFVSGPKEEEKKTTRLITEEYDKDTVYQDDLSKQNVNNKTHYFIETAENIKAPKHTSPPKKTERPDLTNVDEDLKSDECLLSVSAKVNKFVNTAENFLNSKQEIEDKERKIREQHEKIMKIVKNIDIHDETIETKNVTEETESKTHDYKFEKLGSFAKETASSHAKNKSYVSPNLKPTEKTPIVKITTLRSSEAVKKAKAMFEDIASSNTTKKEAKTTKLTDIGVIKKSPITDSTTVLHPSIEDFTAEKVTTHNSKDHISFTKSQSVQQDKLRASPNRLTASTQTPEVARSKSPSRQTDSISKSVLNRYPIGQRPESPKIVKTDADPIQRPKSCDSRDESKVEEIEVSTRRGSGKFGVELRRTSIEKTMSTSERRRSSNDHHQPCIEDIFDLDLLEQMLENVVGYEQRRRIRAQIRVAKKKLETGQVFDSSTYTKSIKTSSITSSRSPDRHRNLSPYKVTSPSNSQLGERPTLNGHTKDIKVHVEKRQRTQSPEKPKTSRTPVRHPSPEKKTRTASPSKAKPNRFNEYASAYMKKVGLTDNKTTETKETSQEHRTFESTSTKSFTERKSSKDKIVTTNGKKTPSPDRKFESPERKVSPTDRLYQRSPSPDFKRPRETQAKETIIQTVVDKKTPQKTQEDKPSWMTSRNLKKTSSETRTYSNKKVEDKKVRSTSPSKVISKPIDVITSSYGPGPLDSDGRPLFGIKALRNGANNYQVRGTVVREEYHSRNGSEPEGTVSVTAYSTNSEDLEKLLQKQGEPVSRLHGLAAITTTKKFGGNTGTSFKEIHTKEERSSYDQFLQNERKRETESRIQDFSEKYDSVEKRSGEQMEKRKSVERVEEVADKSEKKTVRQSSVKSLTEKFIKNSSDAKPRDRGYPKAGLILRTGNSSSSLKDSPTSTADHGITKTDSNHSLNSEEGTFHETSTSMETDNGYQKTTKVVKTSSTSSGKKTERSFLDSSTKVSGVQDILTRMKNADIVIEDGDTNEDAEARALLNKFLGATVLMAGMKNYIVDQNPTQIRNKQETVHTKTSSVRSTKNLKEIDLEQCWDERVLRQLLEQSSDYEQRRRIRARLRALMAEQEACASAVSAAVDSLEAPSGEAEQPVVEGTEESREEEKVTVTTSVRRDSSEKTASSSTTTSTSKVIESMTKPAPKPVSPFAKFKQLEKQNSINSPSSPKTPQSPGSPGQPYFKFTDPVLQASAVTIKERLLQWCRDKTRDYENVKLINFSTSWADGLAFCALIHHFLPEAFDYATLTPEKRRHNFTLAFKIADEKAGIYPLLDVDDMVAMRKPDWKCVFTYVQSIHRRFKDQE